MKYKQYDIWLADLNPAVGTGKKAEEISDFADFVAKRYEEQLLTQGIQHLTTDSNAFNFLHNEKNLYSVEDLKEVYNG